MSIQKIIKVGNSLGIIIPTKFLHSLSLKKGDSLKLSLESNQIICTIEDQHQLSLLSSTDQENSQSKGI